MIDLKDKKKCVELSNQGKSSREIYEEFYRDRYPHTSYSGFRRSLLRWKKLTWADTDTLYAGTYPEFTSHSATVQVNARGEITQAWIKQTIGDNQIDELITQIASCTEQQIVREVPIEEENEGMLEIPLYDMHFPLCDYTRQCKEIVSMISRKSWKDIYLIVGQDLFHNDDFEGRTVSGKVINKVDIVQAWELARIFWFNIISSAIEHANNVHLYYSKGNHDKSLAWAFVQLLQTAYPKLLVDDSMKQRKCIYWQGCFIGITHGNAKKSSAMDLRGQFTIEFPTEIANSKVRELHVGHLHHERESDIYGVMVRRLATGFEGEEWSDDEGFVGAHKRFMLFEWMPYHLKSIHYI